MWRFAARASCRRLHVSKTSGAWLGRGLGGRLGGRCVVRRGGARIGAGFLDDELGRWSLARLRAGGERRGRFVVERTRDRGDGARDGGVVVVVVGLRFELRVGGLCDVARGDLERFVQSVDLVLVPESPLRFR